LIEKHIFLEDIDPVVFYGVNNSHLQMIKSLFPKLRIAARDNVIRILGDEEEMAKIEEDLASIQRHVLKYNSISDEDILDIVKGRKTKAEGVKDVLVYSVSGRPIKSRSGNQQKLVDAFSKNDMIFAVGPAGTGKTYCYTRLMYELNKRYGFHKFIILVPTIPIKEGTMSFIESSYAIQHFADLYPDIRITLSVLNTQKNNKGRKIFPQAIADFARGTLLEKGRISALLMSSGMLLSTATMDYEYDQTLFGTCNNPYDTLKATRPIVLLDEPHKFKREGKAYKKLIDKIKSKKVKEVDDRKSLFNII